MVLLVQLAQTLIGDMGVNLRGGYIAVTEQHLHHTQIRTMIEHVGCKGMAQGMW